MEREEILLKLKPVISDTLNVPIEEVTEEKTFKDLNADSLDAVEAIMEVEKTFNIAIPDTSMEMFSNMRSIVDFIYNNQNSIAKK